MALNPTAVPAATVEPEAIDDGVPVAEPSVMKPVGIRVREDGLYEITRADLTAAGANPAGIDTATFVLTNRGVEVAIDVVDGGDGSFDASDVVRFWGTQLDSEETFDNVYRLTAGVRLGLRMPTRDVTPQATREFCGTGLPGIAEALRAASLRETPTAMLSRGYAVSTR